MFQAATSASLMACPKRGRSGSGCTACGPAAPSGMPSAVLDVMPLPPPAPAHPHKASAPTTPAATSLSLADGIAHLPVCVHCPWLDRIVVLHEADDGARLLQVGHRRLHVAGAIHCAAHQYRRRAGPVPAELEAREALVHYGLFQHGFAPVATAVE